MMNDVIKEKWVSALRSGEYKQGQEVLQTSDGKYCCLGVLTDLFIKETGEGEWRTNEDGDVIFSSIISDEKCSLPADVQEWAGISKNDLKTYEIFCTLVRMNDGIQTIDRNSIPFTEIADYIEEHIES